MKKLSILLLSILTVFTVLGMTTVKVDADGPLEPLTRGGNNIYYYNTTTQVTIPTTYSERDTEFRASWVATVWSLDISYSNETQFKADFNTLIDELQDANMNAMVFQVRSLNDAYFDSDFAPWSRNVTGTEGGDPGWDTLTWMINECHANGIEFHAWLNPYRVANVSETSYPDPTTYLNTLHAENWAKQNPDKLLYANASGGNVPMILNPGEPAVKQYIRDVIDEIVTEYDVDGIHFDDYFYPSSGTPTSADSTQYNLYKEVGQSLDDWRRENVNDVIEGVMSDIEAYNTANGESVKFGVSPSGVWASSEDHPDGSNTRDGAHDSYFQQYADSKKWVEEGWLHYIAPQIYRDFEHDWVPYADIIDWWASVCRGTDVDLIVGQSLYMSYFEDDELATQLLYNQKHPEIKGSIMYRHEYMAYSEFTQVPLLRWTVTPTYAWEPANVVTDVDVAIDGELSGNVYVEDVTVTLTTTSPDVIWYQVDGGSWTEYTVPFDINGEGAHTLFVKTIASGGSESPVVGYDIPIQYFNLDVPTAEITGSQIGDDYVVGAVITAASAGEDIYVAINHGSVGAFELYTGPITLNDTGAYFVRVITRDAMGTDSDETNLSFNIVESCYGAPTIVLTGTGNNPYFQEVTATISSDTGIEYKIDNGAWMTYSTPLVFDTDGEYLITYRNVDECATEFTRTFTVDTVAPANATVEVTGDYDGVRYYTSETTVALLNDQPETTLRYRVHNGSSWTEWGNYTDPIVLKWTSDYYVAYEVVDLAGNTSGVLDVRVRLQLPEGEDNVYVIRDGEVVTYYDTNIPIELPTVWNEKTEEIRAVWIATVANIDINQMVDEASYKEEILFMLDTIEENNFNTVFFQVRPMNDAFYESSYAPWSRYITGQEGVDPGFDLMDFLITECHKRGIEFHAWLNPYRVSTGTESKEEQLQYLHDDNWAKQNPDFVIADNSGKLILNPGERQVQVYIRNVIRELITLYDVDGIHFDDYFYSYNGTPNSADADLYTAKAEPGQSLDDWRRENINTVVREIFEMIDEHNTDNEKTVMFGISPFGIWSSTEPGGSNTSSSTLSSYDGQYADTKRWVEEGWVHYILPQLYWRFDHSLAPFADLADWWAELCEENDVYLIIGHGLYRYGDGGWDDDDELLEQLRYISQYDSVIGSAFFSYKSLNNLDTNNVLALARLNNYYWTEYATFPWESEVVRPPDPICEYGQILVDGVCEYPLPICEDGQILEEGVCVDVPPVCEDDQTLVDGECIDNEPDPEPTCPEGYERINGGCRPVEEDSILPTVLISSGIVVGLGVGFFIFRKFVFKV